MNLGERRSVLWQLFVVGTVVNTPWEIGQAFLYVGMDYSLAMVWHCFVAAMGDGLLIVLIYLVGWMVLRRDDWFAVPGSGRPLVIVLTGLVIAIIVEWVALHKLGRWVYTDKMPVIPVLGIGVVPVLQMLLLPPVVFSLVVVFRRQRL